MFASEGGVAGRLGAGAWQEQHMQSAIAVNKNGVHRVRWVIPQYGSVAGG